MTIRIVDYKKIDMTEEEWELFQKIVKSYTTPTNRGEDLFTELFETNDNGVITLLRPPSVRRTTFEIFLFLMSLMSAQHLRVMQEEVAEIGRQMKEKIREIDEKLAQLK
jgi:hypothetical protein